MASSPSTWARSWNTGPESSFRLFFCCNSSSSPSLQRKNRGSLLISFSSDSSSSNGGRNGGNSRSIRTPYSDSPVSGNRLDKSSAQIGRVADGNCLETKSDVFHTTFQSKWWKGVRLKLLFGKRALWKRIFFASKKVRSIILLNVITVIYASDIPIIKEVEEIMDPALFTCVRFALSAIPFFPFILQEREDGQTRASGIELGFWVSLGYLTQVLGLLTSDAGRASFISAFTVITVPLIDGMLGAKVPVLTWFGALVSLIGVAMLESSGSPPSVGDILNILGAVFFGIHMLRTEHISRVTKKEKYLALLGYQIAAVVISLLLVVCGCGLSSLEGDIVVFLMVILWAALYPRQVCVVALFSTIWYLLMGGLNDMHVLSSASWKWTMMWDWMVSFPWIPALYTGVFSTGLCLWIEMAAMCDVSATETAIIYGLEPVWGAAFAWFLLGERWGTTGWVGAALVLGGSLTVQIWGSSPEKPGRDEESCRQIQVSDEGDEFSVSRVVVSSRKNVPDLLKKSHSDTGFIPRKTQKR